MPGKLALFWRTDTHTSCFGQSGSSKEVPSSYHILQSKKIAGIYRNVLKSMWQQKSRTSSKHEFCHRSSPSCRSMTLSSVGQKRKYVEERFSKDVFFNNKTERSCIYDADLVKLHTQREKERGLTDWSDLIKVCVQRGIMGSLENTGSDERPPCSRSVTKSAGLLVLCVRTI